MSRIHRAVIAAILLVLPAAVPAQGTGEAFSIHGSLNAGYGKSSALPLIGIPTEGTADYRIATVQLRYRVSAQDQFVTQFLNRRVGTSPLRTAIGDLTTQWAFWQRNAGDVTLKFGRAPLPRGLVNEVRYIGTLLPFFRVPYEYSYDAFDAVDGAVASWRHSVGESWAFEAHAFAGGTENRNVRSEAGGLSVRISKANNLRGAQFYLEGPGGLKFGLYGDRYERIDETSGAKGLRNHHGYSAQIERPWFTVRAEHMRETGYGSNSDLQNTYADVIVKVSERVRVAGEQSIGDQRIFPNGAPSVKVPSVRSTGAAINYLVGSNAVLKFEHHWRRGYQFDAYVPPTQVNAGVTTVLPSAYTNYFIASVAFSF